MYALKSASFILNILVINFANSELDLPRGSECLTNENISGFCKNYNECEVIIKGLKSKEITHENVTFCKRHFLIVCCPKQVKSTSPSVNSTEPVGFMNIQSKRISEKKCKEYEEITQQNIKIVGMLGDRPNILAMNLCQHKSIPLITGGTEAASSEFPHQALLGYVENHKITWKCGGSIISSDFILTAAHCTDNDLTYVKVGMISRLVDSPNTATYRVNRIIVHPNYKSLISNEDIALIQLQKNIKFNEHIYPICLPTKQENIEKAVVTGFGNLGNGIYSDLLMKVGVEKFDFNECKDLYEPKTIFKDTMLCYGNKQKSGDSCDGDSGGPLQISNEENVRCTYTQIGIVSFGSTQCGFAGFPAVYVNVHNYIDWIERTVWPGE